MKETFEKEYSIKEVENFVKEAYKKAKEDFMKKIDKAFPNNWLDSRLDEIGKKILEKDVGCPDIEKFVLSIKKELKKEVGK